MPDVGIGVSALFWYPVLAGREVPKPEMVPTFRLATPAEISAIQNGTVVEESAYREFPANATQSQIHTAMEALYAEKKATFDARPNPNLYYGSSWDGSVWT